MQAIKNPEIKAVKQKTTSSLSNRNQKFPLRDKSISTDLKVKNPVVSVFEESKLHTGANNTLIEADKESDELSSDEEPGIPADMISQAMNSKVMDNMSVRS